jgi:DNA-binding transcriptional ArsR family regulator
MTTDADLAWTGFTSSLFRSLSNKYRLLILQHLRGGARTADELAGQVGVGHDVLATQLPRLVRDQLVAMRRDGRVITYSLVSEDVFIVVDAAREMFEGRDDGTAPDD